MRNIFCRYVIQPIFSFIIARGVLYAFNLAGWFPDKQLGEFISLLISVSPLAIQGEVVFLTSAVIALMLVISWHYFNVPEMIKKIFGHSGAPQPHSTDGHEFASRTLRAQRIGEIYAEAVNLRNRAASLRVLDAETESKMDDLQRKLVKEIRLLAPERSINLETLNIYDPGKHPRMYLKDPKRALEFSEFLLRVMNIFDGHITTDISSIHLDSSSKNQKSLVPDRIPLTDLRDQALSNGWNIDDTPEELVGLARALRQAGLDGTLKLWGRKNIPRSGREPLSLIQKDHWNSNQIYTLDWLTTDDNFRVCSISQNGIILYWDLHVDAAAKFDWLTHEAEKYKGISES